MEQGNRRGTSSQAENKRPKLGRNLYWRGSVIWAKFKVGGELHRQSLRTGSPSVAEKRLANLREEIENEALFGISSPTSWKAAVIDWRANTPNNSTTNRYATSLKQLRPWLDDLDVRQVTHAKLREIVRARKKVVSIATVNRDLTAISSVLSHAVDEDWVEENAAHTFDRSKLKETRDPIVLPEDEHIRAVIDAATDGFGEAIELALETGMRQGEVFQAERHQYDKERRVLTLYKTKRKRLRTVPLSPRAVEILEDRPVYLGSQQIFWHDEGEAYTSPAENFRNLVKRVARQRAQAGLAFRAFTFHQLRNKFAVEYLKARRGSIYDLQRILGHKSISTTERYLDHLTPEEVRAVTIEGAQVEAQMQRSENTANGPRRRKTAKK